MSCLGTFTSHLSSIELHPGFVLHITRLLQIAPEGRSHSKTHAAHRAAAFVAAFGYNGYSYNVYFNACFYEPHIKLALINE